MRVQGLKVNTYGALRNWDVTDLAERAVIFHGPNDAGKSTLFDLLTSLLYGFSPATATNHPYSPWGDGAPLNIAAHLVLQDGQQISVHRRLTSRPQGTLTCGDRGEDIGNRPLPYVQHVGRDLYRALYAITAYDLRHLKETHQAEIHDRLLGGLMALRVRPVSGVLAEFQQEANRLWRTDNRSCQHKSLSEELRELRQAIQAARQKESEIRDRDAQLEKLGAKKNDLRRERAELQAAIRRADILVPLARDLEQIGGWHREVGDNEKRLDAFPVDIRGELQRLSDDIEVHNAKLQEIAEQVREQQELFDAFGDAQRQVLEHMDDIRKWARFSELHDKERQELGTARSELDSRRKRMTELAADILSEPWSDQTADALKAVPLAELKARIDRHEKDRDDHRQVREARWQKEQNPPAIPRPVPMWAGLASLVAAALLAAGGWVGSIPALLTVSLALTVVTMWALALSWHQRQAAGHLLQHHQEQLEVLLTRARETAQPAERSHDSVTQLLASIPVAPALLTELDRSLYGLIADLRAEAVEFERLEQLRNERRAQWEENQSQLEELAAILGEPLDQWSVPLAERLFARLDEAQRRLRDRDRAQGELRKLRVSWEKMIGERDALQNDARNIEAEMQAVSGHDQHEPVVSLDETIDKVIRLQKTLNLVRYHEQRLQQEHANLSALREEIAALTQKGEHLFDPAELELAREREMELGAEIEKLTEEIARLATELRAHKTGPSPGELDGRLQALQEELADVARARDRLMLMEAVLRRADREFRERHQPDVLRRASAYLDRITGGRYIRLLILDTESGTEQLVTELADGSEAVPVGFPLSRGTLDQIFLAFRLAVIDHLDQGHEPLPLFLDETLVNWDDVRLENGIVLLGDITTHRQVLLFTCRRTFAELVADRLGVPVVELAFQS